VINGTENTADQKTDVRKKGIKQFISKTTIQKQWSCQTFT